MMRYFSNYLLIGVAVFALNSCDDDEYVSPLADPDTICFGGDAVAWSYPDVDAPRSRAGEEPMPENMGCYAFFKNNNTNEHALIISNSKYIRNASNIYTSDKVVYWPGSHATLDFYCYAPHDAAGLEFDATYGSPSFSYSIPESQTDRCDLLITSAIGVDGGLNRAQALTFRHALTAVNIDVAENMGSVTIKDIKFTDVHCSGNATFDADGNVKWTTDGGTPGEFKFAIGQQNYLIPQNLEGVSMTVNMTRDGQDLSITAPLKTADNPAWQPGTVVNYKLKIVPTFEIEVDAAIDAHYVLCPAKIHVDRMAADRSWTLTVSADDGAPLSVQHLADVNQYALQGFWTDKIYIHDGNGNAIDGNGSSARGTNSITGKGNGDFDIMIFVPENAANGNKERTISISITPYGETTATPVKEIKQYAPDWDNGGWERIEDNESGMYGFSYTARHVLVYDNSGLYGAVRWWWKNRIIDNVNSYNAGLYVLVDDFTYSGWRTNFYVSIDYSLLNGLKDGDKLLAQDWNNGLQNTRDLFGYGGSAVTGTFENSIKNMKHILGAPVLRERLNTDPDDVPTTKTGDLINNSQALAFILKKNKYDIYRIEDDNGTIESPRLAESDILWYMPASGQFSSFSPWIEGSSKSSGIWSSTAVAEENSDKPSALTGSGVEESRTTSLKIRACRATPEQISASYSSMKRTSVSGQSRIHR